MDPRTVLGCSLLLCIVGDIGARSSDEPISRSDPTLPTIFSTPIPDGATASTKYRQRYRKVPNDLHDDSVERDDVDGAPPDHVVPYSVHEDPEEPSTKPRYARPGIWTEPKNDRDIPLDFVPTKLYAQVRGTHSVKRLPREEALKSAETSEEVLAAPRLREVVSKSKTNTVYTEEGYEDAAYDHAGHIRDADFHEEFDRKLENEKKIGKAGSALSRRNDDEDTKSNDEEFTDYEEDYNSRAEESLRIEDKPKRRNVAKRYKKLKKLLKKTGVDPKRVTENGIERLEEDLNNEYKESERNTENEVPENLKEHPGNEGDDDRSSGEGDAGKPHDYENRISKRIDQSENASRAMLDDASGERDESRRDETPILSQDTEPSSISEGENSTSSSSPGLAESENYEKPSDGFLLTPDYGKLFWDYYKTDASVWHPRETSTPGVVAEATIETEKSLPVTSTSDSSLPSTKSTIESFNTFAFTPPSTELSGFALGTDGADPLYPSASSFYESWKRQDASSGTEETLEDASLAFPSTVVQTVESDNDPLLSLRTDQALTDVVGPKKLSYTVIVRDKTTTRRPHDEDQAIAEETRSGGKSAKSSYSEIKKEFEEVKSLTTNDFDTAEQDFTVIPPPLPVPLGQVTFADFLPEPDYGSPVRSSVTQESPRQQFGPQETNGERDDYRLSEPPYVYSIQSHVSHGSVVPRVRHHRGPPPARKRNHGRRLITKLVPPSPNSRSRYANYLRNPRKPKPRPRLDRSSSVLLWPNILRILAGRRRRSISEEIAKTAASIRREKVNENAADASQDNEPSTERNFLDKETNRLVAASIGVATSDVDVRREKSDIAETRKRRSDDSLNDSPRIVDEVINAEIESRFKDEEDDEEYEKNEDASSEGVRAKVEIEVPEFNFAEVIENNQRQKAIVSQPSEGHTLNKEKYPFYANSRVSRNSALQYITDPRQVPRKTHGGTEFYDSRDKYLECADVEPDLEKAQPDEDKSDSDGEPQDNPVRLRGLGDKLDCFRAKYFDENPLDNPLFLEKHVGEPAIPEGFDLARFASRIIEIPSSDSAEEKVVRRISRKPEVNDNHRSRSRINEVTRQPDQSRGRRVKESGSTGRKPSENHGTRDRHEESEWREVPVQTTTQQREVNDSRRSKSRKNEVTRDADRNRGRRVEERGSSNREPSGNNRAKDRREKSERQTVPVQTTTQLPEVAVTPYEYEVYEDVMGTIKNLAGMYQTFGEPVKTPSFETSVNHLPGTRNPENQNIPLVHKTGKPRGFPVQGLLPPQPNISQTRQRYRMIPYRTNKVSYGTRPRIANQLGTKAGKIGYVKAVRIHKRSLNESFDLDAEESRIVSINGNSTGTTSEPAASEKIVYTIRDRIRHSKPRGAIERIGKFTNLEAAGTEDIRRREPRYNRIRSRNGSTPTRESATTAYQESSDATKPEEPTASTLGSPVTTKATPRQDFHDEPGETYKIQYSTPQRREALPVETRRHGQASASSEESEEESEGDEGASRRKNYDVREDLEEEVTPAPAFTKLQKYLESDPPGYAEAFGGESTEPSESYTGENDTRRESENRESTEKEEDEEEERDEQVERPSESYVKEDSAESEEESDSTRQSESYKNSDDDDEEKESEEKDDSPKNEENSHIVDSEAEFDRFASRPYSPFESNHDPKYADLGPRVNKPAFHHPTFAERSTSRHRNRGSGEREYSAEAGNDDNNSEERDGKKQSRYVFPWNQDEAEGEGVEESRHSGRSLDRHEYPWEKRERQARERRKKQKEREEHDRLFGFSRSSEEDEEQDASSSDLVRRRVYPWEYYDVPSKDYRGTRARIGKIFDNIEMGSEYRPVTRFSSKYKSRSTNFDDDDDPIVVAGADPKEIRVSIVKSVQTATNEEDKSSMADNSFNSTTNAIPTNSTAAPVGPKVSMRKSRNWRSSTSTTIRSISATRKPRIWRLASSTTKKPVRSRIRTGTPDAELLKSGSTRKEVTAEPEKNDSKNLTISATVSSTVTTFGRRKIRRRGQPANGTSTTTTTARPVRRRLQKSTQSPKPAEVSRAKPPLLRTTTTPKSKTVEHRSSFSKEEIITKTSYPLTKREDPKNDNLGQTNGGVNGTDETMGNAGNGKETNKERVEKVSITMKKTPEHIYRKEEIDKDGVKGMFVSIIPNNSTDSSANGKINAEETKEMLKRFESTEDDAKNAEDDIGGSFMHDSYLLAHLLRQVSPYTNDLTLNESLREGMNFFEDEGSGSPEIEDDSDDSGNVPRIDYVKDPNERLYYYVEK